MRQVKEKECFLNNQYKKYEVDYQSCNLKIFERVTPEAIIGYHYADRQRVISELSGRVASMYYNPKHNSVMVMVVADGHDNSREQFGIKETETLYIPGLYLG